MNQVSRIQGLFKIFRKDLENIEIIFESKWEILRYKSNISRMKSWFLYPNRAKLHYRYESSVKDSGIIQNIQKRLRKYLKLFLKVNGRFYDISPISQGWNRDFCIHNRAKLHYRYESSVKDSGIFQNIQKRLRKYLKLFLKVNGRFYDISPISQGWNRDFCIIIVRNYIIDMNQVSRIQGFFKIFRKDLENIWNYFWK
jgi:putative component of toxin-antitoxin plasmid stabilization module